MDPQVFHGGQPRRAATGVTVDRVQRLGQQREGRPGASHRSKLRRNPRGIGEDRHDPGDAPLRLRLHIHVRLIQPVLRPRLVVVSDHNRHRPGIRPRRQGILPSEYVEISLSLRRRRGGGRRGGAHSDFRRRLGRGRNRTGISRSAAGQRPRQTKSGQYRKNSLVHGSKILSVNRPRYRRFRTPVRR